MSKRYAIVTVAATVVLCLTFLACKGGGNDALVGSWKGTGQGTLNVAETSKNVALTIPDITLTLTSDGKFTLVQTVTSKKPKSTMVINAGGTYTSTGTDKVGTTSANATLTKAAQ